MTKFESLGLSSKTLRALNELDFDTIMAGREALQYGMDKLDHGGLMLDACLPPATKHVVASSLKKLP